MKVISTSDQIDQNPLDADQLEDCIENGELKKARVYLQVYTARVNGDSPGDIPGDYNKNEISNLWNQLKNAERLAKLEAGEFDPQCRTFRKKLKRLADRLQTKYESGEYDHASEANPEFAEFCKVITKDLKIFLPRQVWAEYHDVKKAFSDRFKEDNDDLVSGF